MKNLYIFIVYTALMLLSTTAHADVQLNGSALNLKPATLPTCDTNGQLRVDASFDIWICDTGTWQTLGSGGGGTPAGTSGAVQFNNAGAFGGDTSILKIDSTLKFVGIQNATPLAPLHVIGASGESVTAPASASVTAALDTSIDSPVSASASEILSPVSVSTPTVSLIQIDFVTGGSASYNGSGNYSATGQTIEYRVYGYRNISGTLVVNPNFSAFSYTDSLNDNSTFSVDLTGYSTSLGNIDGYLVSRQVNGGGFSWSTNIGTATSFNDNEFMSTDAFETSTYLETGTTWDAKVAQYIMVDSTKFRGAYTTGTSATDANVGQYLVLDVSGYTLSDAGFVIQRLNGSYFDIGTLTSFYDWGQVSGSISDYEAFSVYAFPYFDTSLTATASTSATIDYGGGALVADGSSYTVETYSYRTHPVTGDKYFATPDTVGSFSDDGSFNSFSVSGSFTTGGGSGTVVVLLKAGTPIAGLDVGGDSTYSGLSNQTVPAFTPAISSYSGITRNFSVYGKVTVPSDKYASTPTTYSFTDTNPVGGYFIRHQYATFGNATNLKLLQNGYQSGNVLGLGGITSDFYQLNIGIDGNTTVTPNTIGFLGNGTTYAYKVWATKTFSGVPVYSSTFASTSVTLPNDGNFYTLSLTNGTVSGATYKAQRIIGAGSPAYRSYSSPPIADDTTQSWAVSSTVTPTSAPTTAAIFDRASTVTTEPANIRVRNTSGTNNQALIDFETNQSGTYTTLARFGMKTDGDMAIAPTGNVGSGKIQFGPFATPYVTFAGGSTTAGNIFNTQLASNRDTTFNAGSSGIIAQFDTARNTAFFGTASGSFNFDPAAALAIQPKDTSDLGLLLYPRDGANTDSLLAVLKNSSGSVFWAVNNVGHMAVSANSPSQSNLRIGAGNSLYTQLSLDNTNTLPSSPITGGIERSDASNATSPLKYTDVNSIRRNILMEPATPWTANQYMHTDGSGHPTADNTLVIQSGVVLVANLVFQAKQGVALDAGKDLSMGGGSSILGNIRTQHTTGTGNKTMSANNDFMFTYTGTGGHTATLPTAASINGTWFNIKNNGTGNFTIATTSSQTIFVRTALASSVIVLVPGDELTVVSNGSNWVATAYPLTQIANTWSAVQSVNSGNLGLKGSTSGTITLNAAATAGTNTITLPAVTDTAATIGTAQTFTGVQDFSSGLKIGTGTTVLKTISSAATLNFPSIAAGTCDDSLTITVTGAATGDVVDLGAPSGIEANLTWSGYVSASNTVKVRVCNPQLAGAIDPASASWRAMVTHF